MTNNRLRDFAQRFVNLEDQKAAIASDIKDLKTEAKNEGFEPAIISKTVRLMRMDAAKREDALRQHDLFDTYLVNVGLRAGE